MPGRTPAEAFNAFIEPIASAASCLGPVKITPSKGGRTEPNVTHAWSLNGSSGVSFTGGWHFEAQMHYEMTQGAISKTWKVTTKGYRYRLALLGTHLWRIHWHPTLTSSYELPHLHLNLAQPGEVPLATMDKHMPTGRMTFEDAVEWVFNAGIEPGHGHADDWREVIAASRDVHVAHRTWGTTPPA